MVCGCGCGTICPSPACSHGVFLETGPPDVLMEGYADRNRSIGSLDSVVSKVNIDFLCFARVVDLILD